MAEVLRDLVVSLSLKSDNFARNINSINRQIREAESAFRLAGAGVDSFGNTTAGMSSRLSLLQANLGRQRDAVQQYERALDAANMRLQDAYTRQQAYSQKLAEAKDRHTQIADSIRAHEQELEELKANGQENTILFAESSAALDRLKQEYADNAREIEKLTGQCTSLEKATQRAADAVSTAQTNLNNAKTAVKETEAEIQRLTAQLRTAQSAWTSAGTALAGFSTKLTAIGKSATQLGKRMSIGITAPIAALGKSVIQSTIDFESSFASVRKTVEATEAEFARLAAASKEMSTKVAASTTEINEVMATGGQLGIANDHLTEFTRVMIDLGNSCEDLDANNAATQLAKFANIMDTDQSLFKNIGSTIVDLGNNFATTEAPIAEMAMRLAGAGKQIGLTEAQVLGLAAALSSVGIKAQMGGSTMSKALIKMEVAAQTGGEELRDFARVSGMTEREFVEAWGKDPVAVFQKFITGVAQLNDEGISAVKTLDDMGIKEIRLRDTLLRATNANELFARAQSRATRAWRENTALETEANKRYATLESRLKNLKNQAVLFAQTLGDDLRPTVERVMQAVAGFIDRLQGLDASQRLTLLRLIGLAAAAGPAILVFGKLSTGVGKVTGFLGTFCTAVGQAGGGFSGFLSVLSKSPAVWIALGAAVAYGITKLVDWISGAKAAREAQERLNDAVKAWGENVTTAYEKSEGLRLFGLTEEDFSVGHFDSGDWLKQTLQTWTDGKRETDEIVAETVKGFTDGTASIREALQSLRDTSGSGAGGTIGDLDRDLETLDAIDREVESILKKRQNGLLTDDDTARLQALMDQREALRIKYQLVSDTEGAFASIVQGVDSALSRGADGAVTYANAFAAATQGMGAFTDSLNQEYDARYRVISAMEDGAEKEAALAELRGWYNEQALTGQQQYYNALVKTAEETGVFAQGGEFAETADKLRTINALMAAAAGKDSLSSEMNALREALAGLDETGIVEMEAAIAAMESAAVAAGESVPDEVLAAKEALEQVKAAASDTSSVFSDDVASSLSTMFSGLGDEVHEVYATLNCDDLSAAYDAWAEGEHAPIIPDIDTQTLTEIELTGTITDVLEKEGVSFSIDATGNITGITWPEGTVFTTDIKGNITSATTPEGTVYTIDAHGNITAVSKPDGVSYSVDTTGSITGITTPEGISFAVDAEGNITSISAPGAGGEDGFFIDCTGRVSELSFPEGSTFETDVNGNLVSVKAPDGTTYAVDTNGNITSVTTADGLTYTINGNGTITAVSMDPNVTLPVVELQATATVSQVSFDEGIYTDSARPDLEFEAGKNRQSQNLLGLTDFSAPQTYENLKNLAKAIREYNKAVESGDITAAENWSASISYLGSTLGSDLGFKGGQGFEAMAQYIVNGMQLLNDGVLDTEAAEQYKQTVEDLITVLQSDAGTAAAAATNFGTTFQGGLSDALNAQGWETTGDTVLSQIEAGFKSASDRAEQIGDDVSAGIGQGEAEHDFSADAETAISNDENALRTAAVSHSPAARFTPLGEDIAAGVGQGMTQYDFNSESAATVGQLMGTLSSALSAQANAARASARAVGSAISSGIAGGIWSGSAAVITAAIHVAQAAIAAAKQALGIRSPSSVFREEVGLMAMKGLGEGFLEGQKEQARVIRNAARYLTGEAKGSMIVGSTDSRRTYNHNSTVNLNVEKLQVRDEQDIRSLAVEIASLTRQQQRGTGLRMA